MNIAGKSVLVTGGASGLGLATVRRLVTEGARVLVIDLPGAATDALADFGDAVAFHGADVADDTAVAAAVAEGNSAGSLVAAINCAGVGPAIRTVGRDGPTLSTRSIT